MERFLCTNCLHCLGALDEDTVLETVGKWPRVMEPHHGVALQHVRVGAELVGGGPGPVEVQGIF